MDALDEKIKDREQKSIDTGELTPKALSLIFYARIFIDSSSVYLLYTRSRLVSDSQYPSQIYQFLHFWYANGDSDTKSFSFRIFFVYREREKRRENRDFYFFSVRLFKRDLRCATLRFLHERYNSANSLLDSNFSLSLSFLQPHSFFPFFCVG